MKDFTFEAYIQYITAIKSSFKIIKFNDYFRANNELKNFCIIRHDVDRNIYNALKIAHLENQHHIQSTYFFRTHNHTFKPEIITEIHKLGHDIGYHYENLSDTKGNIKEALIDFEQNLTKLRKIVPIKTIAMHGRPLLPYDNKSLWQTKEHHTLLTQKFDIIGDVYLDMNYSDIMYITDTGRNWSTQKNNIRDKINADMNIDFKKGDDLLNFLQNTPNSKIIFQTHPERWAKNKFEWFLQCIKDSVINVLKYVTFQMNRVYNR